MNTRFPYNTICSCHSKPLVPRREPHFAVVHTDFRLVGTGNCIGFISGSLIETSFGIISSSMPALNHLITTKLAKALENWVSASRIGRWMGSGSGGIKSFQQSFHELTNRKTNLENMVDTRAYQDPIHLRKLSTRQSDLSDKKSDLESNSIGMI